MLHQTTPPGIILSSLGLMAVNEREKIRAASLEVLGVSSLEGLSVAIIPTASERLFFRGFVGQSVKYWQQWGAEVSIANLIEGEENIQKILEKSDIIYVPGGNTYTLMRHLAQAKVREYLPALLEKRLYIGESAGSIVAGINVSTAILTFDHNPERIFTDRSGLGLVPFLVWPHHSVASRGVMNAHKWLLPVFYKRMFSHPVERLRNGEILMYKNGNVERR